MAWGALLVLVWLAEPAIEREPPPASGDAASTTVEREEVVDPWASVPLQTARPAPGSSTPVQSPSPTPSASTSASASGRPDPPLLDPWAGGPRVRIPPRADPELRDPFGAPRKQSGPHLARADLRDPFAGRTPGAAPRSAEAHAPTMPPHPELRDPFGRAAPTPRRDAGPSQPETSPVPTPPTRDPAPRFVPPA